MDLDELMKYMLWMAFFIIALFGMYKLLTTLGVM
jgi:hypothetical protein